MLFLLFVYFVYLVLYGLVSYAIAFHLIRYRVKGDKSQAILTTYIVLSLIIIIGSLFFFVPVSQTQ